MLRLKIIIEFWKIFLNYTFDFLSTVLVTVPCEWLIVDFIKNSTLDLWIMFSARCAMRKIIKCSAVGLAWSLLYAMHAVQIFFNSTKIQIEETKIASRLIHVENLKKWMLIRSCPNQESSNEWMYIFVRSILAKILSGHRKIATSLVNYRVRCF